VPHAGICAGGGPTATGVGDLLEEPFVEIDADANAAVTTPRRCSSLT
jgi:hypothetical protein